MDWGRYQRAKEARLRLDVEELRAQGLSGKGALKELPDDVWALIREHDALVGDDDGAGE